MLAADYIITHLEKLGFETDKMYASQLDKNNHHPVVFAQRVDNDKNPTILIYGHYDVQPVDPIEQWESDPFEPEIRDEKIYARGSNDNKGQLFSHIAALTEASKEWKDTWPINVKILFEGEEEAGGENIEALIEEKKNDELFKADVCIVSDTPWITNDTPTLLTGLRGIIYTQVDVTLSDGDLHSGEFGGAVRNPANALAYIISRLRDEETGKILIPGVYDDVIELRDEERKSLQDLPETKEAFLKNAKNARESFGEEGYSFKEQKSSRPTLDVNGIWGGFQGDGAKTIIPATAHAKISMRLVANQKPQDVFEKLQNYVMDIAPSGVLVHIELLHSGDWVNASIDSQFVVAAVNAIETVFGKKPVYAKEGGSIPAIAAIQKYLGAEPVLIGYGLPDDGLHSPNEKFDVEQFFKGIECNIQLYKNIANGK